VIDNVASLVKDDVVQLQSRADLKASAGDHDIHESQNQQGKKDKNIQ
jgi:hypothetical protein